MRALPSAIGSDGPSTQHPGVAAAAVACQPRVGEALEERPQPDLAFGARQRRAEAEVPAAGERQVLACVVALDVEAVRIGEDLRVAVGTGQCRMTESPRLTSVPAISVSLRAMRALSCTGESSRRISSTAVGHSSGRVGSVSRCSGVFEQHPDPVAQQVDRGLEAGRQHQSRGGQQFLVRRAGPLGRFEPG